MEKKILITIILTALALRLLFLSPWLEDWDSVQFALGLYQFSIVDHQPHPPGYPFYILLGRLLNLFFNSDTKSLTFLSALLGSLSIIPFYYLTRKMFDKKTAFLACLFLMFLPVHWVLSEIAISNIPGLFFLLLVSYLIYTTKKTASSVFWVGLSAGVTQGVRATDFPIYISLLTLMALRNRSIRLGTVLILSFFAGLCIWLIPTMFITGQKEFLNAVTSSAGYVVWHDTLQGQFLSISNLITSRFQNLIYLINTAYTPFFILPALLAILLALKNKKSFTLFHYQFLGAWLIIYSILLLLFYNLELPQYTLPLAPALVILVSSMFSYLMNYPAVKSINSYRKILIYFIIIFILVSLFLNSFSQVKKQANDIPPTISPVLYIKDNFRPSEITLITTFTYRQFQYYAPEFKNFYGVANAPTKIDSKFVVIDYKELQNQIPALSSYKIRDQKKFRSDLPFPRIHEVNLYILERFYR